MAYVRQDAAFAPQAFVVANATKLSGGLRTLLTSTVPITLQVSYAGNVLAVTVPDVPVAQFRVYAPAATKVTVNGNASGFKREGEYVSIALP